MGFVTPALRRTCIIDWRRVHDLAHAKSSAISRRHVLRLALCGTKRCASCRRPLLRIGRRRSRRGRPCSAYYTNAGRKGPQKQPTYSASIDHQRIEYLEKAVKYCENRLNGVAAASHTST
jgi:hypothetical protein